MIAPNNTVSQEKYIHIRKIGTLANAPYTNLYVGKCEM